MIELINLYFLSVFTTPVKLLFHMTQKSSKSSMIIIAQCMNTHETLLYYSYCVSEKPIDFDYSKNYIFLEITNLSIQRAPLTPHNLLIWEWPELEFWV